MNQAGRPYLERLWRMVRTGWTASSGPRIEQNANLVGVQLEDQLSSLLLIGAILQTWDTRITLQVLAAYSRPVLCWARICRFFRCTVVRMESGLHLGDESVAVLESYIEFHSVCLLLVGFAAFDVTWYR